MGVSCRDQRAKSTGFGIRQRWIYPGFSTYQLRDLAQPFGASLFSSVKWE